MKLNFISLKLVLMKKKKKNHYAHVTGTSMKFDLMKSILRFIFQLTLWEVMTLGWQATRRCILCTLATRLFHHLPTLTKIPLKITPQAQLALINQFVTIPASQSITIKHLTAPDEVNVASETTRSELNEATCPVAT